MLLYIFILNDILASIDPTSWGISVDITTEIVTEVTPNDEGLTGPEQGPAIITGPGGGTTDVDVEIDGNGSETEEEPSNGNSSDEERNDSPSDSDSDTKNDSQS